jgi:serine/threonine protein phosphatase 1
MADMHGAVVQCLERSCFDYENDKLIQLGDITDGYDEVYECVKELLKIKNLVAIKGNHDAWFAEFIDTDFHPQFWNYGGKGTLISYLEHSGKKGRYFKSGSGFKSALLSSDIPQTHKDFFNNQLLHHVDKKARYYLHGGFDRRLPFFGQRKEEYYRNRDLWEQAVANQSNPASFPVAFYMDDTFNQIFIGHTSIAKMGTDKPMQALNIFNLDTGAGTSGRLTIMDVATKQYWQSDSVSALYPIREAHKCTFCRSSIKFIFMCDERPKYIILFLPAIHCIEKEISFSGHDHIRELRTCGSHFCVSAVS